MSVNAGERSALLLRRQQCLKGTKGNDRERERLTQGEIAHVALNKPNALTHLVRLTRSLRLGGPQHWPADVESDDLDASARDRPSDAPSSTRELEDTTTGVARVLDPEVDLPQKAGGTRIVRLDVEA